MVAPLSLLAFLVSFLCTYAIPKKEQSEAICSNDACYTVYLSQDVYSEASKECVNKGGNLLTIHNEEEAGHVYSLLWKFTNTIQVTEPLKLWIGLKLTLNTCVDQDKALKGFLWITDTKYSTESQFSNWLTVPKRTCIKERCVSMKLQMNSPDNYKWTDELCSSRADGFICKFNFQGMCQRVALAGPGLVEYETPFSFRSPSLDLVPYGSSASVSCGHSGEQTGPLLLCLKSDETNVYQWQNSGADKKLNGPFCASEELGCKYNNGGCEHECVEYPHNKSLSCRCRDGYVLAPDQVSCVFPDHCKSNPCEQKCINHHSGFKCLCSSGFEIAENKAHCIDVNECLKRPCSQTCINTLGSYYCQCDTGFQQQEGQCIDIDECINSNCSQSCLNTHGSYSCSCNAGYTISSDNTSCLDVDECAQSPCAHYCHNTDGSYVCSCPKRMLLSSDHISCIPEQNADASTSGDINELEPEEATSSMVHQSTPNFTGATIGLQDHRETGQIMQSTPMPQETDTLSGNSSVKQVTSGHEGSQNIVLLVSILCACAVLVVMTIIGGVLCHRKRSAKKNQTEKPPSATDNYCWVPDQKDDKSVNNDYR
ncbi:complement component C1q receptor-like [Hyla sarda]|uniref:complement component C1q receptor-like n=1 Tax=Hyla sarda TaxID=327740 RepID=UPI0024C31FAF|nr:complement component C1q receptor-like [Hyla sarda]